MALQIVPLDFENPAHIAHLQDVLQTYAQEEGGGAKGVDDSTFSELPNRLRAFPTQEILVAVQDDQPAGIAICFLGFSTFKAMPVLNIHDLAVLPAFRGQGIGSRLLDAVTARARELDCCKVTLEVIASNKGAHRLYQRHGFQNPTAACETLFLEHHLT